MTKRNHVLWLLIGFSILILAGLASAQNQTATNPTEIRVNVVATFGL